jgi:hypothetical protein
LEISDTRSGGTEDRSDISKVGTHGLESISTFAKRKGTREDEKVVAPDNEKALGLIKEMVLVVVP